MGTSNSHEKPEDVARDKLGKLEQGHPMAKPGKDCADTVKQAADLGAYDLEQPAAAELGLGKSQGGCPLCYSEGTVMEVPQEEEGSEPALVCTECGGYFSGLADLKSFREELRARTPDGWKGTTLVKQAKGPSSVGIIPPEQVSGAPYGLPLVVKGLDDVALVVAAIQYYQGTAGRVMAQAKAAASLCQDKVDFLLRHYDEPLKAAVSANAPKGKRSVQVITSQGTGPTTVGLRKKAKALKVEDREAALAWAKAQLVELADSINVAMETEPEDVGMALQGRLVDMAKAVEAVPEQVVPAYDKLVVAGLKAFWKTYGVQPAGTVVEAADDILTIK